MANGTRGLPMAGAARGMATAAAAGLVALGWFGCAPSAGPAQSAPASINRGPTTVTRDRLVPGRLRVVVRDRWGGPLPWANVVLEGHKRGAVTDSAGVGVIEGVPPGEVSLEVSLLGWTHERRERVAISSGRTRTLHLTLKPMRPMPPIEITVTQ